MEYLDIIKKFLNPMIQVPPTEWLQLAKVLKVKKLSKGDHYFRQGEAVSEISFVVKGLFYNYYLRPDGEEMVKYFVSEGKLVAAYSGLILNQPALYSCKSLEDSVLVTIQYKDLLNLYDRHACWERMGRKSAEQQYVEKEIREYEFLAFDAQERYDSFVKENPDLINRIPQYLIASYLGMSAVSLSRIRGSQKK